MPVSNWYFMYLAHYDISCMDFTFCGTVILSNRAKTWDQLLDFTLHYEIFTIQYNIQSDRFFNRESLNLLRVVLRSLAVVYLQWFSDLLEIYNFRSFYLSHTSYSQYAFSHKVFRMRRWRSVRHNNIVFAMNAS